MKLLKVDKYRIRVAKAGWFYIQEKWLIFWLTNTEAWSGEEIPITYNTLEQAESWIKEQKNNKVKVAEYMRLLKEKIY